MAAGQCWSVWLSQFIRPVPDQAKMSSKVFSSPRSTLSFGVPGSEARRRDRIPYSESDLAHERPGPALAAIVPLSRCTLAVHKYNIYSIDYVVQIVHTGEFQFNISDPSFLPIPCRITYLAHGQRSLDGLVYNSRPLCDAGWSQIHATSIGVSCMCIQVYILYKSFLHSK